MYLRSENGIRRRPRAVFYPLPLLRIERAAHPFSTPVENVRVNHGRLDTHMAHQLLDFADVCAVPPYSASGLPYLDNTRFAVIRPRLREGVYRSIEHCVRLDTPVSWR